MATSANVSKVLPVKTCVRCKKNTTNGIDCIKCGATIHKGCVKQYKNARFTVICCEKSGLEDTVSSYHGKKQVSNASIENSSTTTLADQFEIDRLNELITQQDIIIKTQEMAINSMREQINLLKINSKAKTLSPPVFISNVNDSVENKEKEDEVLGSIGDQSLAKLSQTGKLTNNIKKSSTTLYIAREDSNSSNKNTKPKSANLNLDKSKTGGRRNTNNAPIVGTKTTVGSLKAARDDTVDLHIYNLEKNTEGSDVLNYLKQHLPKVKDVHVVQLASADPEFKITINKTYNDAILKLLDPFFWPRKVSIKRFPPPDM